MKLRIASSVIAMALAAPLLTTPALGQVSDFQLQPAPTPTATPRVQGPVDTEGAVPVAPRVIPTASPTTAPAPSPTPTAATSAPTPSRPAPTATRTPATNAQNRPQARPQVRPAPQPSQTTASEPATDTSGDTSLAEPETPTALPTQPAPLEAQSGPSAEQGETSASASYWPWIGGLAGLLLLIGGAVFILRRRSTAQAASPEIEPPAKWVDASSDASDLPPLGSTTDKAPAEVPAESVEPPLIAAFAAESETKPALQVKTQALTLSRSLMNATLSYQLELMNLNNRPITDVSVRADVVTAHGKAPVSDQVADTTTEMPESVFVASIDGRDTHKAKGTFSLPVGSIRPITQRGATLYVPLLRLRVDAAGMDPIICTFVVGVKPPERGAKLQPFRLDEMAQTYRNIGLRLIN